MIECFEEMYFVKKLYFDCGRTVIDYIYGNHINLADRQKLAQMCEKLTAASKNYIRIHDNTGRAFTLLCSRISEKHHHKSNIFFYNDDVSSVGKLMGIYISTKDQFIMLTKDGIDISAYYYHSNTMKCPVKKYLSLAESYFEKSEYIAKKR